MIVLENLASWGRIAFGHVLGRTASEDFEYGDFLRSSSMVDNNRQFYRKEKPKTLEKPENLRKRIMLGDPFPMSPG